MVGGGGMICGGVRSMLSKVHVELGVRMNKRTDRCVIVMSPHTHCLRPNPAPVGLCGVFLLCCSMFSCSSVGRLSQINAHLIHWPLSHQ